LSGSGTVATVNPAPPAANLVSTTPAATNSVAAALAPFPPLWINELQADNLTGITNRAGQRTAWLELYNPGTNVIPLNGFYLANNYTNLMQWAFPSNAVISAGQFKVIFADALTNLSTTNELHTSFVLPGGAGSLALSRLAANAQLQVLDYVNYTNLGTNYSYGSFPDAQSFDRRNFYHATPGAANDGTSLPPPSFIPYASAGVVYSQNFDALPNPGATSVNSGNPVTINGTTYSLANPFDFALPVFASGSVGGLGISSLAGWYGLADPGASVGTRFGATDGDQTTGGIISFGLPNSSSRKIRQPDRRHAQVPQRQVNGRSVAPVQPAQNAHLLLFHRSDRDGSILDRRNRLSARTERKLPHRAGGHRRCGGGWYGDDQPDQFKRHQPGHHQLAAGRRLLGGLGNDGYLGQIPGPGYRQPELCRFKPAAHGSSLIEHPTVCDQLCFQLVNPRGPEVSGGIQYGSHHHQLGAGNGNPLGATNNLASPRLFYRVRILSP